LAILKILSTSPYELESFLLAQGSKEPVIAQSFPKSLWAFFCVFEYTY
jgi:hypothetical protein